MPVEETTSPGEGPRTIDRMTLADLEAVRVILRGASVVDWRRLHLDRLDDVDRFLRLNQFDLADPQDERRLRSILAQSVAYLRTTFGYRVIDAVADPPDLRDLFHYASGKKDPREHRRIACVVLKCMHVVHHLEARELLFRTALREADLAARVDRRVMAEAARMSDAGFRIVEFVGNVKSRASLVTKLLAKRETHAAQIFDRVRYRIITEERDDIVPVVWHLSRTLFPFNFAVPGQSHNSLVSFSELVARHPDARRLAAALQEPADAEEGEARSSNAFTARGYRVLNFVVDLPLRIDELLPPDGALIEELGRVVFLAVEFQVLDAASARRNDQGTASHARYKERQLRTVLRRLSRGLVVPKRRPTGRRVGKE